MVAPVSISGKEGKLKGQLARAVAKLKKAKLEGNPQAIRAAELRVKKLEKFGKKPEIGKAKRGDPRPKQEEQKTPAEKASPFSSLKDLFGGLGKKKKSDMQKEIEKRSGQTAEEMYGMGELAADPGGPMSDDYELPIGFKHGGRLKKTKKRKPRGIGAALRGYGKAMRHG